MTDKPLPPSEKDIERYLTAQANDRGALVRKLTYQGQAGAPDRMLVLPSGKVLFVECKAPGGRVTRQQHAELCALRKKHQLVAVVRSKDDVDSLFRLVSLPAPATAFAEEFPL